MRRILMTAALIVGPGAALAHHPGEHLDEEMAAREPAFEAIDTAAPDFALTDAAGAEVALADLADRVVVLVFPTDPCRDACATQMVKLADVRDKASVGGMDDRVAFVAVTPTGAAPGFATAQNLDPEAWRVLGAGEGAVEAAYAATLGRDDGPVAYVLDRGGRLAGAFHGTTFGDVNMLLYINGLTNGDGAPPEAGWLDGLTSLFD